MTGRRIFLGLSLVWCLFVGSIGYMNIPSIPLDLSAGDAATIAAYNSVLWRHYLFWGTIALFPILLFVLINLFFKRS